MRRDIAEGVSNQERTVQGMPGIDRQEEGRVNSIRFS